MRKSLIFGRMTIGTFKTLVIRAVEFIPFRNPKSPAKIKVFRNKIFNNKRIFLSDNFISIGSKIRI
jgi:hypothetical protein